MSEQKTIYTGEELSLTPELVDRFFETMISNGRQEETVKVYRRALDELIDFLPEDQTITLDRLESWREYLDGKGYAPSTINLWASAVNSLMRYCGFERTRLHHTQLEPRDAQPELSRSEYLSFMAKVREIGSEQEYILIKVFATMNITIRDLPNITVEAVGKGCVKMSGGREEEIPVCLLKELDHYIKENGIMEGPVFVTRSGNTLDRSNIAKSIRILAGKAGIEQEKCCPRALHRMYIKTREEIWSGLEAMYDQAYDSLLNTEQMLIGWDVGK
ncbi:MAG: site-specific integrase [Clostridiales bacterium]|nr:site-specific integrase [Clostridiales bacterium]